jgi:hypothetical protein
MGPSQTALLRSGRITFRATSRNRTDDPVITNDVLYRLSYGGDPSSGAEGSRTPDLLIANEALSQLSYGPNSHMGARGLEPLTSTMSTWRSNQLSYAPKVPVSPPTTINAPEGT